MGKHERKDIELMEKSVAMLLMRKRPLIDKNHKWFKHMLAFANYLNKTYPDFRRVKHIGNQYGQTRGDLELITKSHKTVYIELKASETESGKGTLANISQDALTEYGLVSSQGKKKLLSWSEFRETKNFKQKIKRLLGQYQFPNRIGFYQQARLIREKAKQDDPRAIKIKNAISILAKEDKSDYLNHIRQSSINEANLKKFVFCLLTGIHTKRAILSFIKGTTVRELEKFLGAVITLYANLKGNKVVITRDRSIPAILFKPSTKLEFSFPKESGGRVYTYITYFQEKDKRKRPKKLLGLVLHWKNIFQGVKTPCINVFLV